MKADDYGPTFVGLAVNFNHPALQGMSSPETYILLMMLWQMDLEGRVYGVPDRVARSTWFRLLKRLAARGIVEKAGIAWRVRPEIAWKPDGRKRIRRARNAIDNRNPGVHP